MKRKSGRFKRTFIEIKSINIEAIHTIEDLQVVIQTQKQTSEQGGLNMRFPNTEAKIIALAQKIIAGLRDNPNFPNPPTSPDQLQVSLDKLLNSRDAQVTALAAML